MRELRAAGHSIAQISSLLCVPTSGRGGKLKKNIRDSIAKRVVNAKKKVKEMEEMAQEDLLSSRVTISTLCFQWWDGASEFIYLCKFH